MGRVQKNERGLRAPRFGRSAASLSRLELAFSELTEFLEKELCDPSGPDWRRVELVRIRALAVGGQVTASETEVMQHLAEEDGESVDGTKTGSKKSQRRS